MVWVVIIIVITITFPIFCKILTRKKIDTNAMLFPSLM